MKTNEEMRVEFEKILRHICPEINIAQGIGVMLQFERFLEEKDQEKLDLIESVPCSHDSPEGTALANSGGWSLHVKEVSDWKSKKIKEINGNNK